MKKEYKRPMVNVRYVTVREIIVTSEIIGGDDASDTSSDAPRRNSDWDNYFN